LLCNTAWKIAALKLDRLPKQREFLPEADGSNWGLGMKRLAVIGAGLLSIVGFAGAASAADLPARTYTKAPAVVMPIYDWSGFYIGLNGGGASSHNCGNLTATVGVGAVPPISVGCHDATGGLAGGQIGYRWQVTNWVFGLE